MRFFIKAAALFTLCALLSGAIRADASTVAYWRFEEGTAGNPVPAQPFQVLDSSGNSNTLQSYAAVSSPVYSADTPGSVFNPPTPNALAIDFGAGNQSLYTSGAELESHPFSQFTFEASVKFNSLGTQCFLDKDGSGYPSDGFPGVFFGLQSGNGEGVLYLVVHQADGKYVEVFGQTKIKTGQWYNLAAVSDGANLSLYIQTVAGGAYVLDGFKPFVGVMYPLNGSWVLGRGMYGGVPGYAFDGKLDEVRISDAALTESQFLFHYTNPVPLTPVLAAASGYKAAFLSWTGAGGATSYTVKRSAVAGGPYTPIAAGVTATTYTDLSVTGGATYYYVVAGVNSFGAGANSNEASAQPAATYNPVAYWRFEEGTAGSPIPAQPFQVPDSSGNSNTLQTYDNTTAPSYTADVPGDVSNPFALNTLAIDFVNDPNFQNRALYTNGSEIESHPFNQFTFETSFKFSDITTTQSFLDKDGSGYPSDGFPGVFFGLQTGNGEDVLYLVVHQANGKYVEVFGATKIAVGQWYNVAGVSNGLTMAIYIQTTPGGPYVLDGSAPFTGAMYPISGSWVLGRGMYGGSPGYLYTGKLDEVRISDVALDSSQFLFAAAPGVTVTGNIALEGVADLSKISAAAPLGVFEIQFRMPGTKTVVFANKNVALAATAGNANGKYTLTGVPAGTYDVWIKGSKNLASLVPGVTIAGTTATVSSVLLNGGDVDNDNTVGPTDFGVFVTAYNSYAAIPGTGYDPTADFNFDGAVDPTDFAIFVGDYNTAGAP